jgi:hypothetical protein
VDISEKITHNVSDVGDVLGAETSKNKGNPFYPPLFLQAPKMWRNEAWDWFRRNHDLAEWSPSRRLSAA